MYMQTIVNAVLVHFSVQKNISKILFICLISDDKNLKS